MNFGYATFVVVVFDEKKDQCKKKMAYVRDLLNNNRIPSIIEKSNAVEAYLGSFPGEVFKNVRKPFISTQNLANMIPLNNIGPAFNITLAHCTLSDQRPYFTRPQAGQHLLGQICMWGMWGTPQYTGPPEVVNPFYCLILPIQPYVIKTRRFICLT